MSEAKQKNNAKRRLAGVVASAATNQTRVVVVEHVLIHARYGKRVRLSRRLACHDEQNSYKVGDKVEIEQTRPISRTKKWRIVKKLN
ncbi:MAG: 30S ribosomal protein S17 [Patescibacteria group bacterium]